MDGRTKWGIAGLVLGLAAAFTLPTMAQTDEPSPDDPDATRRTVTASGTATVGSTPDEAVLTLGVQTQGATAEEAMAESAQRMSALIAELLDQGLREDDLATAWLNLYPQYADAGSTIVGYQAENQVTVTVRALDRIGRIIDRAVQAGANLMSGITFGLSDDDPAADRALAEAVADARGKAEVLAEAGGASLGEVVQITESAGGFPPPIYRDFAVAEAAGSLPPVLPPTLETQVSVTVVWALV